MFLKINHRANFLLPEVPVFHPKSMKYRKFWRLQKKRCIEGFWAPDDASVQIDLVDPSEELPESTSWRWAPPNLYFYVNFGIILHKAPDAPRTAPKKPIRPHLRDLEWEYFYNFMEARGFSGFEDDLQYSCNKDLLYVQSGDMSYSEAHHSCFNEQSDGELIPKQYVKPKAYLRQLRDKPLGRPLFFNEASNIILLGARGGGKSYLVAVGVILHEILFDGAKLYNQDTIDNPPLAEMFVGSAIASKSHTMLKKTQFAMENMPGIWAKGTTHEEPHPFYKHMSGSIAPNSKWEHKYEKKIAGKWKAVGTHSNLFHGVFTIENPEAAAGGRYSIIAIEEVGLLINALSVHGSNEASQMTDGTDKYGTSIYLGTGGNMEKIVESEILFRDPVGFHMLTFNDEWENSGKIGWFVPAYYMDGKYKDHNGNTDIEKAKQHYENRRVIKKKAKSPKALEAEMVNYPLYPSEMFMTRTNSKFPVADLKFTYGRLMGDREALDNTFKGLFSMEDGKPIWVNDQGLRPIREYPYHGNENMEGCIEIFEPPAKGIDGIVPSGVCIGSLDPIDDDDNTDSNRSLQSGFIMNILTGRIVAEYTGRTRLVKDFYEQFRRLLMYYNAKCMYENQKKGFYQHMYNTVSIHMLAETPQILLEKDLLKKIGGIGNKNFGIHVSAPINSYGIDLQVAWMDEQAYGKDEGVKNWSIIKSPGYLKECILFNGDLNADRVSSMGMLMIYREERLKFMRRDKHKEKEDKNDLANDQFFKKHYRPRNSRLAKMLSQ